MSEDLVIGLLLGATLAPVGAGLLTAQYKKTLRLCAKAGTPEKLGGEFFYIVPEAEFLRVKTEALLGELARATGTTRPADDTTMRTTVYTVHAYRWGDRECHNYSLGVYSNKRAALRAASTEEEYRGGKYECEVLEWSLDSGIVGRHEGGWKTVKPLSDISMPRASKTS